jgi:hypothetical protein
MVHEFPCRLLTSVSMQRATANIRTYQPRKNGVLQYSQLVEVRFYLRKEQEEE